MHRCWPPSTPTGIRCPRRGRRLSSAPGATCADSGPGSAATTGCAGSTAATPAMRTRCCVAGATYPERMDFAKGHGTQNDFVLLPDLAAELQLTPAAVAAVCDRRRGLGADGLLRVTTA